MPISIVESRPPGKISSGLASAAGVDTFAKFLGTLEHDDLFLNAGQFSVIESW